MRGVPVDFDDAVVYLFPGGLEPSIRSSCKQSLTLRRLIYPLTFPIRHRQYRVRQKVRKSLVHQGMYTRKRQVLRSSRALQVVIDLLET